MERERGDAERERERERERDGDIYRYVWRETYGDETVEETKRK